MPELTFFEPNYENKYMEKKEKSTMNGWTKFEKIWCVLFTIVILAVTVVFSIGGTDYSNPMSIFLNWFVSPLSAITGLICVVLAARGSIWTYAWGIVNCVSYGFLAYHCGYYGDMILNVFYFLPFQFIGFAMWKRHLRKKDESIVIAKRMNIKQIAFTLIAGVVCAGVFGMILSGVDNWFTTAMARNVSIYTYIDNVFHIPYLGAMFDSSTEVLQIVAQILMVLAFTEQWIAWIITDVITVIMWFAVCMSDPTTIPWALPTLIMWIAYLVNAVYGMINWRNMSKKEIA